MNGKIPTADFIGVHHLEAVTRTEPDLKPSHSDMRCGDPRKHFSYYTTRPSLVSYLDSVIVSFVNCYHCEKPNKSYTGFLYILLSFHLPPFTFILMIRIESISLLERHRKIHTHAWGRERKWEREKEREIPSICWFTPKVPGWHKAAARNLEFHAEHPHGWQGLNSY